MNEDVRVENVINIIQTDVRSIVDQHQVPKCMYDCMNVCIHACKLFQSIVNETYEETRLSLETFEIFPSSKKPF